MKQLSPGTKTYKENQKRYEKYVSRHHPLAQSASQHDKSISDRRTDLCVRAAYSQYCHDDWRRPRNRRQLGALYF